MDEQQQGSCPAKRCRASIRWVKLSGGGLIPVDVGAHLGGPLIPAIENGRRVVRARLPGEDGRPGLDPHWATCPDPAHWERVRRSADRSGVTVAASGGRLRGVEQGPCAGCRRPDHVAYGPDSPGTLCAGCRDVLAAWRALPSEGRGPIPYVRGGG